MSFKLRNLILIFSPVLLVTAFDLAVKRYVVTAHPMGSLLFMKISLTANRGIIGGLLSSTVRPIHQVSLITIGFSLLVVLYFIQLFAPIKSTTLRVAISLFVGGTFANVIDRLIHGFVIDYLVFSFFGHSTPALNVADIAQYLAVSLILVLQFRRTSWDESYTKKLWVSPHFQKRYSFQLVMVGTSMILLIGGLSLAFVSLALDEVTAMREQKLMLIQEYLLFFTPVALTFLLSLFLLGKSLSAYIARPILRFEVYLHNLSKGNYEVFQLDEPDFAYLEHLSDKVRDHITELHLKGERLEARAKRRKKA